MFPTTFYPKKTYKKVERQIWAKSEMKKWGPFFISVTSWFAILGHFWGPFLVPKRPENAQKRANLVFPTIFYPKKKHTKKSNDKYERNWRYEKMRSFFAVLRAELLFWAISGARFCFKKGLKMPKKGQTWCFQPPFTLRKHTKKSNDKYERNPRYEKMRSFFCSVTSWFTIWPISGTRFASKKV